MAVERLLIDHQGNQVVLTRDWVASRCMDIVLVAMDEAPVAMLDLADRPQSEIVLYHDASGVGATIGRSIRLATGDSIAPGTHVLTGRIEVIVKQGAHGRRGGANQDAPVILSRQEQFRVTFDVPSP